MKKIVILCDGTWNSADAKHTTNVVKVRDALSDKNGTAIQKYIYDEGVGASGNWLRRCFEGATGTGLSKNIRDVYAGLMDEFNKGDQIYLFGFSRGAYTVRSLAGMIRNCGILKRTSSPEENSRLIKKAFKLYRSSDEADRPSGGNAKAFRARYSVEDVSPIHFIGVWDTVGALGNPLWSNSPLSRRNKFHDTGLSSIVANAYHALSIDEKRLNFKACLWEQPISTKNAGKQVLEQVWFAGVHADIGGGYEDTTYSDIPLKWMMDKAAACGLAFKTPAPATRSIINKDHHHSWNTFYKMIPPHIRPIHIGMTTNDTIHQTAKDKYKLDQYRPQNLSAPLG